MAQDSLAVSYFDQHDLPQASMADVQRAKNLLKAHTGIVLGEHKHDMASRTLALRAHEAGAKTVSIYLDQLQRSTNNKLWSAFVNSFTINHTAFYRERHHFEILSRYIRKRSKPISIWCCAASTGEEPYTIAISLAEAFANYSNLSVTATDIDSDALAMASKGIYSLDRISPVPEKILHKYFLRGSGKYAGMVMVKPSLRELVDFSELNLVSPDWHIAADGQKFDAIFCRNTLIYFDKSTQVKILERFVPLLKPGGLLFVGHSENFTYLTQSLRLEGQTVYSVA